MRVAQFTYYRLSSVLGQVDPVTPSKDFPGADLLGNLLQWGVYTSLALSVVSIMYVLSATLSARELVSVGAAGSALVGEAVIRG